MSATKIVKQPKIIALLISLAVLAIASTGLAIFTSSNSTPSYSTASPSSSTSTFNAQNLVSTRNTYETFIPVAISSWVGFGVVFAFWRGNYGRSVWREAGLDKSVYDLMVKMRGGNSRLELLRNLESPKQRNELSQLTGIDWKEVDRQVNLLHSYGLVSVYAETGSVKIYKLTEQGQLILKLIGELNG